MRKSLLLVCFVVVSICVRAQQHHVYISEERYYKSGLTLLEKENYLQAQRSFKRYLQNTDHDVRAMEARYYYAFCALKLNQDNAILLADEFLANYPNHPRTNSINYEVGKKYYFDGNYVNAVEYLAQIDFSALNKEEEYEGRFFLGYAYFVEKNLDLAEYQFDRIKNYKHKYTYAANYYTANIKLKNGNLEEALRDFQVAGESESYSSIVPYIIASIYYKQGNNDSLISYGERVLSEQKRVKNKDDIQLLVGEAYFSIPDYDKVTQYLEPYANRKGDKTDLTVQYKLGYAYFMQDKHEEARAYLQRCATEEDTLSQYASYYLGHCLVALGNKDYAINSFKKATSFDYSKRIKEDAKFALVKLYFEKSNFNEVIQEAAEFISLYPRSQYVNEVNELISTAYLNTNDYEAAIAYIEALPEQNNPKIKAIHQKVTYYRGVELFNSGDYQKAMKMFGSSTFDAPDEELKVQSYYWWAECYSIVGEWQKALEKYNKVLWSGNKREYFVRAHYGAGYSLFILGRYNEAQKRFTYYTEKSNKEDPFYSDAFLRLADCYYQAGDKQLALKTYEEALQNGARNKAYAYLQTGELKRRIGDWKEAIEDFNTVINRYRKSTYYGEALFRKSELLLEKGEFDEALTTLNRFLSTQSSHPDYGTALLKRAITLQNLDQQEKAIADFDAILNEYCNQDQLSKEALLALESIYTERGEIQKYESRLQKYAECHPEDANIQHLKYQFAENLYFDFKYDLAIPSLKQYMLKNPGTPERKNILYYLADSYYGLQKYDTAILYFDTVLVAGDRKYLERSLYRLVSLHDVEKDSKEVKNYASRLYDNATNPARKLYATTALMKAHFEIGNYDSTKVFAEEILQEKKTVIGAQNDAHLYLGRSHFALEEYDEAKDEFITLINNSDQEDGAQAGYYLSQLLYKQEKFEESLETLFDVTATYKKYRLWYERAFLLIAQNYIALNEKEQAELTLQSVVGNSKIDEIKVQANRMLSNLNEEKVQPDVQDGSIEIIEDEGIKVDSTKSNSTDQEIPENMINEEVGDE